MEKLNLSKKVYAKRQYERVIDTNFSELASLPSPSLTPSGEPEDVFQPDVTISEFFQYYSQLFLQIPKEGEINSHEYLIKTSSEYINFTPLSDEIQILIDEINILQQTNLELNQQLVELQSTGSR